MSKYNHVLNGLIKDYITRQEEKTKAAWPEAWGWVSEEYRELQKKLQDVTKNSKVKVPERMKKLPDKRNIVPLPEEVNHDYGWISTKKEFQLEIYGPDIYKPWPLKEQY